MNQLLRRGTQMILLGALALGFTVSARAHGGDEGLLHACVKRENGQLRLVLPNGECRPSEVAVDWSRSGAAAGARTEYRGFFEVADAGGASVGPVVGFQGLFPVVGFKVEGVAFILFLVDGTLYGSDAVYFASVDCSPPGHIPHAFGTLPATGMGPSGQVYVENWLAADATVSAQSLAFAGQCYPAGWSVTARPAVPALTLGAGPFVVR